MKRAALYMRVSTDQQAQFGDSLRAQKDALHQYTKKNKIKIYDEYVDDGISGQKINRDAFQKLLDDAQAKKFDLILFTKLDRWGRNLKNYLNIQETLEKNNITWKAINEPFYDTSTPIGRTIINQMMNFGELEAQMTSERIRAVFENKVTRGEVISGKVPYGYKIENKRLVIDEEKAQVVRFAFDFFLQCCSMRKTLIEVSEKLGIMKSYNFYKGLFRNERYIGIYRNNENYCPAIIDKETFEAAQRLISKNETHRSKRVYLFSKLLKCSCCGRTMSGTAAQPTRIRKDGTKIKTIIKQYKCQYYHYIPKQCTFGKTTAESKIEKRLLAFIKDELEEYLINLDRSNKEKRQNTIDKEVFAKKIESKLVRLKEAYLNEIISLEEYREDRKKLELQLSTIETGIEEEQHIPKKAMKNYSKILQSGFEDTYKNWNETQKKKFWLETIDYMTLEENGDIRLYFL